MGGGVFLEYSLAKRTGTQISDGCGESNAKRCSWASANTNNFLHCNRTRSYPRVSLGTGLSFHAKAYSVWNRTYHATAQMQVVSANDMRQNRTSGSAGNQHLQHVRNEVVFRKDPVGWGGASSDSQKHSNGSHWPFKGGGGALTMTYNDRLPSRSTSRPIASNACAARCSQLARRSVQYARRMADGRTRDAAQARLRHTGYSPCLCCNTSK